MNLGCREHPGRIWLRVGNGPPEATLPPLPITCRHLQIQAQAQLHPTAFSRLDSYRQFGQKMAKTPEIARRFGVNEHEIVQSAKPSHCIKCTNHLDIALDCVRPTGLNSSTKRHQLCSCLRKFQQAICARSPAHGWYRRVLDVLFCLINSLTSSLPPFEGETGGYDAAFLESCRKGTLSTARLPSLQ
ncbi:unnamed protein product [Protopolystoma xenopodis]|uniref:Uncharacterized protein n=1 Tax=Protopolystoma xenopodis TaxID=117903 RepID=A0A3S4ZZA4_9PLAT|nr:unnamed protein product [Protopolystoma xenopodis]